MSGHHVPAGLPEKIRHYIDGEFVDSVEGETFDVLDPVTNETYVTAAAGQKADVDLEVARRRLDLAWFERGDPALALELARALARAVRALPAREGEAWELRARMFEGAALAALERRSEAEPVFAELVAHLRAASGRRTDLFPSLTASPIDEFDPDPDLDEI